MPFQLNLPVAARRILAGGALFLAATAASMSAATPGDSSTPRWAFSAGKNALIFSSPAIGPDHTIYFGVEYSTTPATGLMLAIRPDGSQKWQVAFSEEIEGAPAISEDGATVYVGCADARLYALDTANGAVRWTYDTGRASAIYAAPAIAPDGTIYIGSTNLGTFVDSTVYAIAPNGDRKWVVSAAGAVDASPAIAPDGTIYIGAGKKFFAITPAGAIKWEYDTTGNIYATAAIDYDGTIYMGADGSEFVALTPDGKVKWTYPVSVGSGTAIGADGTIYIGATDGFMYALDASGKPKPGWPVNIGGAIFSVPAIRADGTIIFGANDNAVHALNPDGTTKWTAKIGDVVDTSPAVDTDGTIYIGSYGGQLFSFEGSGSPVSQLAAWPMFNHGIAHRSRASVPITGGQLINLTARGQAGPGFNLIAGVVLQGSGTKPLLVRAVGPTLSVFGVQVPMPNPTLTVHPDGNPATYFNDDWGAGTDPSGVASMAAAVGAFGLPAGSKDAALIVPATATGGPSVYTTTVGSADGGTGVALVETYDGNTAAADPRLINLSARGHVGTGENILIPGLVIGGQSKMRVLIRAVGPGLTQFGVSGILSQPSITMFNNQAQIIGSNTGWTSQGLKGDIAGAAALTGAFPLADGSADSAMILSLDPGPYTFQVSGVNGGTGEALVEVYVLPH